ncbi:MOP flippase family protein [Shewanella gaetbuli]
MSLKKKAISGIKWTSLSSVIVALVQIFQVVILARYLSPSDFGLMAIVSVVIGFSALFMDMGVSSAIIHRQDISIKQLSSLYWLNLGAGLFFTMVIFLIAPLISTFYGESSLTNLIRLLSFTFIISAIGNQYRILYQKNLEFNHLAKVEIFSAIVGLLVAIFFSVKGFGVYSLVYATLSKLVLENSLFLVFGLKKHKPTWYYNYSEIKSMIGFGMFQMGERSMNYFNSQFDTILIGKLLGPESLGIYTIAKTLVMKPAQIINPVITRVTFPVMARVQNDDKHLRNIYLKTINYLCSINGPIYIAIAILAEPIVLLFFGIKWLAAVSIVQILSCYFIFRSIGNPIGALQLAKGRADLGFYWNGILFFFYPAAIYLGSFYGLEGVAYSLVILSLTFSIPNWYFMVKRLCGAGFFVYFCQIFYPLALSSLSAVLGFYLTLSLPSTYYFKEFSFLILATIFYVIVNMTLKTAVSRALKSLVRKSVVQNEQCGL